MAPPLAQSPSAEYTVVARRYRPQQFSELIGQEHVAKALVSALTMGRVAHAYLFTGSRGVGKTSAARILAKALNCVTGPTATPCDSCPSCIAVAAGDDIDVLEIDGASNNKVEEVRDLRQNVGFRPTRGRYKIYIIDEVHMLTTAAFNALLKTLEEPPPHVKFILATTEVQKIPITILSRCQRFDFAPVGPAKVFEQLRSIVTREGLEADEDALRVIARRAAGSMRDSQSLLDQLLASSPGRLTLEQVHAVLGSTGEERVTELAALIIAGETKSALELLAGCVARGIQIPDLLDQFIEYWRSMMLLNCGGPEVNDLPVSPVQRETILAQATSVTLDTILAGLDVWTSTKAKMKGSNHGLVLLEMAIVRLSRLGNLISVADLASFLSAPGVSLPQGAKPTPFAIASAPQPNRVDVSPPEGKRLKKNDLTQLDEGKELEASEKLALNHSTVGEVWKRVQSHVNKRSFFLAKHLRLSELPAIFEPNSLVIRFETQYTSAYDACLSERNSERIREALHAVTGQEWTVSFKLFTPVTPTPKPEVEIQSPAVRRRELMQLPLFRKAGEVLAAQINDDDPLFNPIDEAPDREPEIVPELEPEPEEV